MIGDGRQDELQSEALRPRRGFLIAASLTSFAAVAAYIYEEAIVSLSGSTVFAIVLAILVLLAMFFVLCFRVPRIGNKLLGFDVILTAPKQKEKASLQYTGSFNIETGAETKRMNTKRKQARHSRRKFAEVTRKMQAEQASGHNSDEKGDERP